MEVGVGVRAGCNPDQEEPMERIRIEIFDNAGRMFLPARLALGYAAVWAAAAISVLILVAAGIDITQIEGLFWILLTAVHIIAFAMVIGVTCDYFDRPENRGV